MDRARRAAVAALVLILTLGAVVIGATPDRRSTAAAAMTGPLAVAPWPAAPAVVLAEVVTGGTSASDEYIELTNRSSATVDLAGLELVYVTSTGTTVTRKASWSASQPLDPGQHLLVANAIGRFAASADATYSGGLSATGGALAIRLIGASATDAVGWGDATNAFVEGIASPAPSAGSSIERRPGGTGGNVFDTNDNAVDWTVVGAPLAQNLAAPPVPAPGPTAPPPTATPTSSPSETPTPTPSETPTPTPSETPTPTPSETPTPTPSPTPPPTPSPSETPTPTPSPTPPPTPSPTPTSTPMPIAIAAARVMPSGQVAMVEGVVTAGLGSLESGRSGFIQDATGGIGIYLDPAAAGVVPSGTLVRVTGVVDDRYAQRVMRVAASDVIELGSASLPDAQALSTGAASESIEGGRVSIVGMVVESPTGFADGLGLLVDDGSGPLRAIVAPAALGGSSPARGDLVTVTGPLGQHDSSGTGTLGYRVLATSPGDLIVAPAPTPTPTPTSSASPSATSTATPTQTPSPDPTPTGLPSLSPTPSPTPTPGSSSIAAVRSLAVGTSVTVQGVVTAQPGRVGGATLLALGDASGGIFVRLPEGSGAPGRGTLLVVSGKLADPYGQLELRAPVGGIVPVGAGAPLPNTTTVEAAELGEPTEGRLVALTGTIEHSPTKTTGGGLDAILIDDAGGRARILVAGPSGVVATDLLSGHRYRLTGIVGQHASHKGALDGYRLWLRDRSDIVHLADPSPDPSGGPSPSPTPGSGTSVVSISRALGLKGRTVAVEGVVTIPARLLEATGRRIVIQDATAAIEVLIPSGSAAPKPGRRARVVGEVGRAYEAPRIRAKSLVDLGAGTMPSPRSLSAGPTVVLEWQLVRVAGTVLEVHRLGDRWRAELRVGSARVAVVGLPGAAIPSTALVAGRRATIVGIARRAYPGLPTVASL